MEFGVAWAHGPDFAEVAEALGISTDMVLARMLDKFVMYTDEEGEIMSAILKRDEEGILRVLERTKHPGMAEEFARRLEETMAEYEEED
jgi:hypothetical protein